MSKASKSRSKTQPHSTGHKQKTCKLCQLKKPVSHFEVSKGYRSNQCRACRQSGKRKRISQSPYAYISNLYNQLSYRRKKTHDFNITREYLHRLYDKQEGLCAYTGITMTHVKDGTGYHLSNISIDRVDNTKGYVEDNIALVCLSTNMMKYTMELKDLVKWCKLVAIHFKDEQ